MKIGGLVTSRGESTTADAIDSLRPHVDDLMAWVDDRTPADFDPGVASRRFTWRDSFAEMANEGMGHMAHCDWVLHLDADERLDGGDHLRGLLEGLENSTWSRCPGATGGLLATPEKIWNYPIGNTA